MTLPGTLVSLRDSAPPRRVPTDTSVWFVAGFTEQGPQTPQLIENMVDYATVYGDRVSYGLLYDSLDTFFREGGSRAYAIRVLGPTPVAATANLFDAAGSTVPGDRSLIATAASVGDWGNKLNVEVIAPLVAGFRIKVTHDDDGTLETSPDLADQAAAVTWSAGSSYIRLTLGASAENPRVQGPTSLTTGTDDHLNATDATWKAALDLLTADLGPGQVSMPGRTTTQSYADTLAHALATNRIALLDGADTASRSTLVTAAGLARAANGATQGSMWAPWAIVPGVVDGTTRTVPYSAVEAGIMARNDADGLTPNQPAAGERYGQAVYALGLSQVAWTDADRELLNDAGVNVGRVWLGGVVTYGYRALVSPSTDPLHIALSNARLTMRIRARCGAIGERYVFLQIDGRGFTIGDFHDELTGELVAEWNTGSLYGLTPAEAFSVDTGDQVNTPTTIAARKLRAVLQVRESLFGEIVEIEIVRRSPTDSVT